MENNTLYASITKISELPEEDFALLLSCARQRDLKKGERVLDEGEICRSFYLVTKGHLRTWYNKNGVPINLNFTFEGSFASNLQSYKSRQPSELVIAAGEDSAVWVITIKNIAGQFGNYPQIALFFRRLAVRLLLASEEHSNLFKIYTPAERYRYIEENHPQLLQRIPLSQIASYIGVARETLSRIRAKSC